MKGRVLAVDYGRNIVGLAVGDLETKIAFPRDVIKNRTLEALAKQLVSFCLEEDVKILIFGDPLNMKKEQEDNPIKKDLDALVELFKQSLPDLKIEFVDERLTTFEAGQFRGFDKRGSRSDDLAAKIILQRYFDSL